MFYTQVLKCPVCNERLGSRDKKDSFEGLCKECDFFFYFPPNIVKPTSCVARKRREARTCGCDSCQARDSKQV